MKSSFDALHTGSDAVHCYSWIKLEFVGDTT